jgi:DNA replication protein DnaC
MRTTDPGDAARIELLLAELRLPAIKLVWASLAAQADKEGWPAGRFLAALAEHEIAERSRRRLERHLAEARLPPGRTLDSFDFEAVPVISKAQVMALAAGDAWLNNGANLLLFGPPGGGKSHLAAALGFALVENGLARTVHPHHRSRPAAANCASRARSRSRHRQARQIPPADPR